MQMVEFGNTSGNEKLLIVDHFMAKSKNVAHF